MSTGFRHCVCVLRITFQLMAITYLGAGPVMAIARFDPYVSEFEFASRFHPSNNPDCLNGWSSDLGKGNDDFQGANFAPWRSQRSPEEGSPVGEEPSIEVRAILVRCPRTEEETDDVLINRDIYNITAGRSQDILDFHGFDRDEPAHHSEVRHCRRKLIITMKFNNIGRTKIQEEFVVIDHVMDPVTMHKSRLLNPFVVKVRQEPVLQLYGLKFQGVVNAEAREEVINKKLSNYTGCDDGSENPTCGQMIFEGKPIPYSQGFCCSCDPELNVQRQASLLNESMVPPFPSFFSKSKDRLIRPFKSPRSVNENFLDGLSDLEETFQNKAAKNEEMLGNSNNANFEHNFALSGDNNLTLTRNLHDDETDLIYLKNANRMTKENANPTIFMTDLNTVVNKNTIEPYKKVEYQKSFSRQSNTSRESNEERKISTDAREFQGSGVEVSSNYKPTESRYMSHSQNTGRVNLTAELMKLEEDYKNLRMSSRMRAESRNNEIGKTTGKQNLDPPVGKYSGQSVNDNRVDNFLSTGRIEDEMATRIGDDRQEHISTSTSTERLPLPAEGTVYGRVSTLSIDVLFAIRPKQKLTTCPVNSTPAVLTTCPMERTTTQSSLEAATPAVLRQKLVSDRVYPSSVKSNAYRINAQQEVVHPNSMKKTTDLSRKFGTDIIDHRGNVAIFDDPKMFNNTQSNIEGSRLRKIYNATNSENSVTTSSDIKTESIVTSEGATENLQQTNGQTQSFDNLPSQLEILANSSSSFSTGNHSKNDAILLSGSLKNQLADWFSYDKRKKFGWEMGRKKSREDVGELTTSISVRRPVQVQFQPDHSYKLSHGIDNGKFIPKTRNSDEKLSEKALLDYSGSKETDISLSNKSGRLNVPRSYRSIADDDSFSNKDNDQQRSIDKKIEDEFVDISEALKDAADSPKIIRGRPKSESTFEKDNSVIEKFDLLVNEVPGSKSMIENHLRAQDVSTENPAALEEGVESKILKPPEEFVGTQMSQALGHDIPIDRLNSNETDDSAKIMRQNLARDSSVEANKTKVRKISPFFSDFGMREASRYDNHFQLDDQASGSEADAENYGSEAQTKIGKHTEGFSKPVSEILQTTGHQIIVDRFKLGKTFHELPEKYKQTLKETIPTHPTYPSLKMRDLKEKEPTTDTYLQWTSHHTNERNTEPVSEIVQTLGPKIVIDRFKPIDRFPEMPGDKSLLEQELTHSSFTNVPPKSRYIKEQKFFIEPIAIVMSDNIPLVKNDTSFQSALSPVLMIENLKKELRKEAERFSSVSTSPLQSAASNSTGVQKHSNFVDEVNEVNTELTSAAKALVRDEKPLPPDEETQFTTTVLTKNMMMPSTVSSDLTIEVEKMNNRLLPRPAFQDFQTSLPNKTYVIPSKRTNKLLILVEESSQSSFAPYLHLGIKRSHKKRHHRRHRHQRISRNKRRSIEPRLNITRGNGPAMNNEHAVTDGKSENEDDEHPWYDTTTNTGREKAKNLNRREMLLDSVNTTKNHQQANESPNRVKPTYSSGKLYVSLSRIPETDHNAKLAGLRVEEIPKVKSQRNSEAEMDLDVDEAGTSMMNPSSPVPEVPGEVDEIPIFQGTEPPRIDDESNGGKSFKVGEKGFAFIRKIKNATGIAKRNFQTLPTPKFRSFYPKSNEITSISQTGVDDVTCSENVGRNNNSDDVINSNESNTEALFFHDYDAVHTGVAAPVAKGGNDENKRSLESFDPENKNGDVSRSSGKSAAIVMRRSERRSLAKRNNPVSRNHYFSSRLDKEEFGKNPEPRGVTTAESTALLDRKDHRSGNMPGNQFRIEPSSGWKEKMELLKLKKHADVLKEYLNWRHDIVPPEPHGISGYTTKISMTNEKEQGTTEIITTHGFNVLNETTLPSTFVTNSSVTDNISSTIHDQTAFRTVMSSKNDDVTKETVTSTSSESSSISLATNHLENCSCNEAKATNKTGYPHYETTNEKASYNNEASTGKILPPCCPTMNDVVTCPTGLHTNVDRLSSPPHLFKHPEASPKVVPDHRGKSGDIDNDLIIISIMEKNRLINKNVSESKRGETSLSKMSWIRENGIPDSVSHHRRHKPKNKINYPASEISTKARPNRRARRHLMAAEDLEYKANNEEDDLTFDDFEEHINLKTSADADIDTFNNQDSEKLKKKWIQLMDKVIRTNSSELWESENSTKPPLPELPGDSRSAMKQLHFINANKYIRQMAKKIAHNSNIHDTRHETGMFGDKNRARKYVVLGRKLKSYPSLARRKIVRKVSTKNNENFDNYEDSIGGKQYASRARLKMEDSYDDSREPSAPLLSPAPQNVDSNVTLYQETSDQDQSGRDFAISLTGKIHVEGGIDGQPMSISFDTSPENAKTNGTMQGDSNETADFDNSTNTGTGSSPDFLSSLFNIASVPKDLAHHSQEADDNFNSTVSEIKSAKATDATNLRSSRENHRRKLPHLVKKSVYNRKSRAVDEGTAVRFPKNRDDRSFDLEDPQDLEDVAEESDPEDYPESVLADNSDFEHEEADDAQLPLPKQRNLNSRHSSSDIDGDLIHQRHNVFSSDVKVIKIIPLEVPKPFPSFSSSGLRRDNVASKMTAFQFPKMEEGLAPGATIKRGKTMPAALPWQKNEGEDDKSRMQDMNTSQQDSKQPCSPTLNSTGGNLEKEDFNAPPVDRRVSTSNPVSLKIISLVSMDQASINETKNPNANLDANYEVVPLIHVKIKQQPNDRGSLDRNHIPPVRPDNHASDVPSGRMEGRPENKMTKSNQHFHGDDLCSSSDMNNGADKTENDGNSDQPGVVTMNMDNDEELREPIGITSCPESNHMDGSVNPNLADDNKFDRIRPTEEPHSCGEHRGITTSSKMSCEDASNRSDVRKRIRLKNMLAIMEFMKKIKGIISSEDAWDMTDTDSNSAMINSAKVVVSPINRSKDTSDRPAELDGATDRFVMMGEGINHERPHNADESQSEIKERNGTAASLNTEYKVHETRPNNSNWKAPAKDQDKSFLFYGNNNNQAASRDLQYTDSSLIGSGPEQTTVRPNEGFEERQPPESPNEVQQHNTGLFTILNNTNNIVIPETDERQNFTNSSVVNSSDLPNGNVVPEVKNSQQGNESKERDALLNLQRKINDRLRGLKKDDLERNEREDVNILSSKKERSVVDNDFSSIPEIKRYRLRSNPMRYRLQDPRKQIHRIQSLPTGGEVSQARNQKFRRLADGKDTRKRKRKKKKKKKKKKRKKKKHKKKGKDQRGTEIKGKVWGPFGRQLMSFSKERELALDMNLDQDQIEGIKNEENRNRRVPVTLERRIRRRVHRAKFPHGKKKKIKKRHMHKKVKKKKKKKKKKGESSTKLHLRSKRQIRPGGTQVRGGQDCMDRKHPPNVNPAKYLESAHCLRFSELWYSVYELESPIMEHTVYLQLFEKHNRADGVAHWEDLTQGSMVRMGTFTRHQRDNTPTIVFTYSGAKTETQSRAQNLDPSKERLLVPSPVPPKKDSDYPEVRGGSGEYLVVKASAISRDGNECDKAGVGFAAFLKQQDRCGRTKDSCLKNQPLAYWRHDMEARKSGRPGCYFLSNFASVPTKPIKYNVSGSSGREYLGLEYHSTHVSAIDIEVRTDYNAIVRVGSSGRVTEVYVDSTALEHTVVTVVISNMGLASSPYQPRITDCPTGLPVSWTKAKGIMQVIPPQHDQRVTLDLYGQLLLNEFHCSVEVVNHRGELVAMRRIRVQKMDRCFCVWHCLCACIGSVSGMGCQPVSPEHYHAAGFQGPIPVVTTETSILMNAVKNVLMLSALLVLLLLLLGMLKWFVGMFAPAVGRWGLDSLLDGSRIDEYLEPELRCRCVMTDDDGWPVHPDTGERTVRFCSRKLEFVLNLIFFLTYPIAVCCTHFKRSLNSSRQRHCCPDESKMCLINEKGGCSKMICVSTYGENKNSKLEAEDTKYVMNELKKSQESLENPKRTKKKDGDKKGPTSSSKKTSHKNKSASDVDVKRLVDDLLKSRMVFRNLTEPIGGLRVPSGTTYSLRGYFLNAENGGYRFITPCPFKQHWLIENNQKKASKPPETYPSNLFMRSFVTARDVWESNELSLNPKGVCINVQYQEET